MAATRPRLKRKTVLIILLAVLLLAAAILAVLKITGLTNNRKLNELDFFVPGAAESDNDPEISMYFFSDNMAGKLSGRLHKLLGVDGMLRSWYQLPLRSQSLPAQQSEMIFAEDQIRYGWYLCEHKQKQEFERWRDLFETNFMQDFGIVSAVRLENNTVAGTNEVLWPQSLAYVKLLMQAYSSWPSEALWQEINWLSDNLLNFFENSEDLTPDLEVAIPTIAPPPDPAATPTPKPEISPTPEPARTYGLIRLASIDLLAIRQLGLVNEKWNAIYLHWLDVVKSSQISSDLPLYALAVWPDTGEYLYFESDQPHVSLDESLRVMLHLAECAELDRDSLSWVSQQLYNNFALFEEYNIIQGSAATTEECLTGYAMLARIARIESDSSLYEKAVSRLSWHLATLQRSEALDTVFRQDEAGLIRVFADDNTWALLAFR